MPPPRAGPPPRLAVAAELLRAAGGLALLPWRLARYRLRRSALRAEIEGDLAAEPERVEPEARALHPPLDRPLRVFVACAEASGEVHARSFVAALRRLLAACGAPPPEIVALGGAGLAADGVELVGRPVERAAMGFAGALGAAPYFVALVTRAAGRLREWRPDLFVPVDSPALNVPLARVARRYGVPAVHFVTPQYWGWAPWRASAYRSAVDLALTILPFEPAWFARRGVPVAHVGHPLLDALAGRPVPSGAGAGGRARIVLLPGSRAAVIRRNLSWMLVAAGRAARTLPDAELVVAQRDGEHEPLIRSILRGRDAEGAVRLELGDLHGTLAGARAALSVSGTVLLDLLHQRLPAVVVYRVSRPMAWLVPHLLTTPFFASVNLLARREVYPEFCFAGEGPLAQVAAALARSACDEAWRRECAAGLETAARRLGPPGAAARAAAAALGALRPAPGPSPAERAPATAGAPS